MDKHSRLCIIFIKLPRCVTKKHNRKFEPLGFMNGQDFYGRAAVYRDALFGILFLQLFQIQDETMQAVGAVLLKTLGNTDHLQNIGNPPSSVRHGAAHRQDIRFCHQHTDQLCGIFIRCG